MECNVGIMDKIIRTILGVLIVTSGLYFNTWLGMIGMYPISTALLGVCLVYVPFRISTCDINQDIF